MTAPIDPNNQSGARRAGGVRTFTETKAGPKTSEFILTVVFVLGAILAAYASGGDTYERQDGWRYAALVVAAYVLSRGFAKLGVREPYTDDGR